MQFKALVSTVALGAAMALSGSAFAQTINGVDIPEGELAIVQERCDELSVAANNESLVGTEAPDQIEGDAGDTDDGDSSTDSGSTDSAGQADATIDSAPPVNEMANATSTIDLTTIDLQACIDAGLVTM